MHALQAIDALFISMTLDQEQSLDMHLLKTWIQTVDRKCEFGIPEINFLGHTITGDGIKPNKYLKTVKLPKSVNQTRGLIGFLQYFQKLIPDLAEKLQPFCKLLRKENAFILNSEDHVSLE